MCFSPRLRILGGQILFSFLMLAASCGWASTNFELRNCVAMLQIGDQNSSKDYLSELDRLLIEDQLSGVEVLRTLILGLIDNPEITSDVKNLIRNALTSDPFDIVNLTDQIRKAWSVPSNMGGFIRYSMPFSLTEARTDSSGLNDQKIEAQFRYDFGIAVPEPSKDSPYDALLVLVHELAHFRMQMFLNKNIEKLAMVWPSPVAEIQNGRYVIHRDFFNLLQEKFAYTMEYKAYLALTRIDPHLIYPRFQGLENSPIITEHIGQFVSRVYDVRDPRIRIYENLSFSTLLKGWTDMITMRKGLESVYTKGMSSREFIEPRPLEAPFVAALSKILYPRQRYLLRNRNRMYQLRQKFEAYLNMNSASFYYYIPNLFLRIVKYAEQSEHSKNHFLNFLNEPLMRETLLRSGWNLPGSPISDWEQMKLAFPMVKSVLEAVKGQENFDILAYLMNGEADLNQAVKQVDLEKLIRAGYLVDSNLKDDEVRNEYLLPIRDLEHHKDYKYFHQIYFAETKWELHLERWTRLGLGDEFIRTFPDKESFIQSPDSILQTYRKLMALKKGN